MTSIVSARYFRMRDGRWAAWVGFRGSPPSPGDRVLIPGRNTGEPTERVLAGMLSARRGSAVFDLVPLAGGTDAPELKAAAEPAIDCDPDVSPMGRHYAAMAARRHG